MRFAKLCEGKLTLKADEPLPFWKAMDLLCNTADVCYGLAERTRAGNSQASYDLFAAPTKREPYSTPVRFAYRCPTGSSRP